MSARTRSRTAALSLLLCGLVLLAGCSGGAKQQATRPLYSGSDGVILSFPESNALQQYQQETFTVALRLLNDGTSDINKTNPGVLTASFDPSVVRAVEIRSSSSDFTASATQAEKTRAGGTGSITDKIFSLLSGSTGSVAVPQGAASTGSIRAPFVTRGRSQQMTVGDVAFVELTFEANNLPENRASATTPLTVQVCYPYTTTFISDICVDRDLLTQSATSSCSAKTLQAQPQGAPIAVRSVTPRYTRIGDTVQARYEITLENLKGGIVLSPGGTEKTSLDACDLSAIKRNSDDPNDVVYGVAEVTAQVSTTKLKCGSGDTENGMVRFDRTTASIVCRFDGKDLSGFATGANYGAPIIIQARYFYIQNLPSEIEVKKR